jgi:cyclic nucleotide gated channel
VFDPHGTFIRQWNKVFVVACLVAAAVDPLFFFLLEVDLGRKCVQIEHSFAVTVTALRCITDLVYFLQMLLQFRVAYVAPSSRIFGRGELVVDKESIASHYLRGNFVLDFVAWLPIPQVRGCVRKRQSENQAAVRKRLRLGLVCESTSADIRLLSLGFGDRH